MTDAPKNGTRFVSLHDTALDSAYIQWMIDVKQRYRRAQLKAAVKINSEQLLFNWQLGRDLVIRRVEEVWGSGIVEKVSLDLKNEFMDSKGFSTRNLWNMRRWYLFYSSFKDFENAISELEKQLDLNTERLKQLASYAHESSVPEKMQQPVAEIPFPRIFGFVPWGHHVEIISKCGTLDEALFYLRKTVEEGLSRSALTDYIKADLFHSAGRAVTNFEKRLSVSQGKLAQQIVKDVYDLSFVTLPAGYNEDALEDALERNITRFLLELGTGFAFVGRQKEIIVSGRTRRIDMLFYHIRLRCYVVVELKVVPFEPEFVGKLNFYINAVNELMRSDGDNPTVGLLICRDKNQTEVKWAIEGVSTPMGVASYDNVRISEILEQLPSEKQIQKQIELAEEEYKQNANKSI